MSCKHKCIRIKADFSTETLKAKEGMEWSISNIERELF
jgi:hypothetical protein